MIFINIIFFKKTPFPKNTHKNLASIGMLWMALPFYLFAKAEETISSSLAGLINGSTPIFIGLIAVLIYKENIYYKFFNVFSCISARALKRAYKHTHKGGTQNNH